MIRAASWILACVLTATPVLADDWPQWLGPQRDAIWRETGILEAIPAAGLKIAWKVPVAGGYSGPAVARGKVYVMDFVPDAAPGANDPNARASVTGLERVLCIDEESGAVNWIDSSRCAYDISYPLGPRCTPTVDDGRVYCLGAQGRLKCLNAETGMPEWYLDFANDLGAAIPLWGWSSHPVVWGNLLICVAGGKGSTAIAFDKVTGQEVWRSLSSREPGYAPPTLINFGGRKQVLIWDAENLHALQPENGQEIWKQPIPAQYGMTAATPKIAGDVIFATAIGNAGGAYRLNPDGNGVTPLWQNDSKLGVYCEISSPHIVDGVVYGTDCQVGCLRAVDLVTGQRLWETFAPTSGKNRASHGTAFLIRQGDRFILFSETGDLIFAKLTPEKYEEQGRFHVLEPTSEALGRNVVWSHPAFANGAAFVRNDKELVKVWLKE